MERFQTLPEVRSIALGTVPLMGAWTANIWIGSERERALAGYASDTYFDLFGIPVVRGRHLSRIESEQGANLAVVSESAARKFWPGKDPIGRIFKLDTNWHGNYIDFEVIGVAK